MSARELELVEGGWATYVGVRPHPSCTKEQIAGMPLRGELVRDLHLIDAEHGRWLGRMHAGIVWTFDADELVPYARGL